jgi:CHAT domain-containing protein
LGLFEANHGRNHDAAAQFRLVIAATQPHAVAAGAASFERDKLWAAACDSLGVILVRQGHDGQAAREHQKAIGCLGKWIGGRTLTPLQQQSAESAWYRARLNLAIIDKSPGNRAECKRLEEELTHPSRPRDDQGLFRLYRKLADSYFGARQGDAARDYAAKARRLAEWQQDTLWLAQVEHDLATYDYVEACDNRASPNLAGLKKAEQAWLRCLKTHDASRNTRWIGQTVKCLGDVALAKGQWKEAAGHYRRAVETLDIAGAPPTARYNARFGLAHALSRSRDDAENRKEAVLHLKHAIRIVEAASAAELLAGVCRDPFFGQYADACDLLIELLHKSEPRLALLYAEKLRDRTLDNEVQLSLASAGSANRLDSRPDLDKRLDHWLRERDRLRSGAQRSQATKYTADQLQAIDEKLQRLWHAARNTDAASCQVLGEAAPDEDGDFGSQLRALEQDRQAVLYYYLGNWGNYLWLITGGKEEAFKLTISREEGGGLNSGLWGPTDGAIQDLLMEFDFPAWSETGRGFRPKPVPDSELTLPAPPPPSPRPYETAYKLLPSEVRLKMDAQGIRRVIIVPDGGLHRLPFQALVTREDPKDGEFERLIDAFPQVSYAPSLRMLSALAARSKRQPSEGRLLTVGGDYPHQPDAPQKILPYSRRECETVADIFPELALRPPLTDRRARARLIGLYAPECRFFHFSNHAVFESQPDKLAGGLVLYGGERLHVNEICALDFRRCELAALSACSTSVDLAMVNERPRDRETYLRQLDTGNSLARAFLVAGAARVVASFWDVEDKATCDLMHRFFREVGDAMKRGDAVDYSKALHAAMQGARRQYGDKNPRRWAPFALIGPPVAPPPPAPPKLPSPNRG